EEAVVRAHRQLFVPPPVLRPLVPTSREQPQTWRYTTTAPPDGWTKADFDDSKWSNGPGGFGTAGTPAAVVRTEWRTADVWLRRAVELPERLPTDLRLLMHHDDDAEVYVNGVLAAKVTGYTTAYQTFRLSAAAQAALRPGRNVLAVHCHQVQGGQYIDVGVVE